MQVTVVFENATAVMNKSSNNNHHISKTETISKIINRKTKVYVIYQFNDE